MEGGYGLCGHKNSYSTGVKMGNYVEDTFGGMLAKASTSRPILKHSEMTGNYIHPSSMKQAEVQPERLIDLMDRNQYRNGLSYNLLFDHGIQKEGNKLEKEKYIPASYMIGAREAEMAMKSRHEDRIKSYEISKSREERICSQRYVTTNQALSRVVRR